MDQLTCTRCGHSGPDDDFYVRRASIGTPRRGRTHECKTCILAKPQRPARPEQRRRWHLKKTYGITLEQYDALFAVQGGLCAICGTDDPGTHPGWCLDHDHSTGQVRSILCNDCNSGIGRLKDDPALLRTAADYLDRWRASC